MAATVYIYDKCSTCRNALKWLDAHGVAYQTRPIREQPPTAAELERMLEAQGGDLRKLFNTSSKDYREAKLGERLPDLSKAEAFKLLRANGNLVKRPFVVAGSANLVGFKPEIWSKKLAR
jgi:arsenate reductase